MKSLLAVIFSIVTLVSLVAMYGGFLGIPVLIIGFLVSLFTSLSVPFWAPFASLGVALLGMAATGLSAAVVSKL